MDKRLFKRKEINAVLNKFLDWFERNPEYLVNDIKYNTAYQCYSELCTILTELKKSEVKDK